MSPLPGIPRTSLVVLALCSAVLASPAVAQEAAHDSTAILRFGGDVMVPRGTREGAVVVLRGDAIVAGDVRAVVVIDGEARISGGRVQELTVVKGRAVLTDSARVMGDVHLLDAEVSIDPGSSISGRIERGAGRRAAAHLAGAAALIGLGFLVAIVLGGVFVASIFPDSLRTTGSLIRHETGPVLLATGVLWIALPIVAVVLIPTLIGLPMGLGYFLFVLPVVAFLGLIVAGTWLGDLLVRRMVAPGRSVRPTISAAVGISVLAVVGRIPLLGLAATALILLGTGALALQTLGAMRAPAAGLPPAPSASL